MDDSEFIIQYGDATKSRKYKPPNKWRGIKYHWLLSSQWWNRCACSTLPNTPIIFKQITLQQTDEGQCPVVSTF